MTEEDILNLNNYVERNMMNNKISPNQRLIWEVLRYKEDGINGTGQ